MIISPPPSAGSYSLVSDAASCSMADVQGVYTQNKSTTLQVDVASVNLWNIVTTPVSGLSFSGSGTFTATGVQTVILNATGTPSAAGLLTIPTTAGTSNCSFAVTVVPAPAGIYNCKIDGVYTSFSDRAMASNADGFGDPQFSAEGYTGPANGNNLPELQLFIRDNDNSPVQAGTYYINHFASLTEYWIEVDYTVLNADKSTTIWNTSSIIFNPNPPFTITITSITNNHVKGTFSGKVTNLLEGSSKTKVISDGVFDLPIHKLQFNHSGYKKPPDKIRRFSFD